MMIQEKLGTLQIRHLVQLIVCALAIYLLRVRKTYQLVPSWRKDLDPSLYANGKFPSQDEQLPRPIVTDLDGDGSVEAVFITNDFRIQVDRVFTSDQSVVKLPHTTAMYSQLLPRGKNAAGHVGRPVVMETGFLDQYQSEDQLRNQVILVLFSNWYLVCYDHELRLLWQQLVMDTGSLLEDHRAHSMGILVTPHTLQKGDRGLVIVGGSFAHKGHDARNQPLFEEEPRMRKNSEQDDNDDTFTKFSTFAFSGANGTTRWYHLPGSTNYRTKAAGEDAHHWKLSLRRGHWPHGKVHWSRFGTYLLQHTPHHWHQLKDTAFDLANIRKLGQEETHPPSTDPSALVDLDLGTEHLIGRPYGGMRPHSRHEHVPNPNAVVVHHHLGVEVLSIHSGQLITDLRLDNPYAVYADVNHDGNLDRVRINFAGSCQGEASTIHPRPKAMFAGDICQPDTWWSRKEAEDLSEDTHLKVAPVVVKSIAKPQGLLNHLLGKSLPSERKGYDSVFVTSTGTVTSFNHRGHVNWKTSVPTKWSDKARAASSYHFQKTLEGSIYLEAFKPSMIPLSLQLYGPESSAVISGWDNVVIVHLQDGFIQAQHTLPCQTLQQPIIADFNGDGWNDIIITCSNGYIGLSIHRQPQYFYMTILSITIVLSMLLLSWCCQLDSSDADD